MTIQMITVQGRDIEQWLQPLAALRIQVFREFPYLYGGTIDYEKRYLSTYIDCPQSLAVLLTAGGDVVGASTGIPLAAETSEFKGPVEKSHYDVARFFYCGESIILPQYRGRGLYRKFFDTRERHARHLGGITHIGFCAVIRDADHPLQPDDHQPLDQIWRHFGYRPQPQMIAQYRWQDIDKAVETDHPMMFWVKPLM